MNNGAGMESNSSVLVSHLEQLHGCSLQNDIDVVGPILQISDKEANYLQSDQYYSWYYACGCLFRPRVIAEIGVRFGYSLSSLALGARAAGRDPILLGWDNECYSQGSLKVAGASLRQLGFHSCDLQKEDTQLLDALRTKEEIDLFHVDGSHTYEGALHDLELALTTLSPTGVILVDDVTHIHEVNRATRDFCEKHNLELHFIPTFRGLHIVTRNPNEPESGLDNGRTTPMKTNRIEEFETLTIPGTNFKCLANDSIGQACIDNKRLDWNRHFLDIPDIRKLMNSDSVVLDIGAYIGDTTALFANRGCEVYAFEPWPDAFHCLEHNFRENTTVHLFNAPVGNRHQSVRLRPDFELGNLGSRQVEMGSGTPAISIDDLNLERCDFIKIDAEGFEPHILNGAKETIERLRPLIYLEINPLALTQQGFAEYEVYDLLESLGYDYEIAQKPVPANFDILCRPVSNPPAHHVNVPVHFEHGLGDCANFAHVLALYRRRGYHVRVSCQPDKAKIFQMAGAQTDLGVEHARTPWHEAGHPPAQAEQYWTYNKAAINISAAPLPSIGTPHELWNELSAVRLNASAQVGDLALATASDFVKSLPGPVILIHTMGNTSPEQKNLPGDTTEQLYVELLRRMEGSLVLLDWDDRMPRLANYRVRHLADDWQGLDIETLSALMYKADLLIGIDSGPLHMARLTDIPTVGLFPTRDKYPSRYALPKGNGVNLVPRSETKELNVRTRLDFNIVECGDEKLEAGDIAELCMRMLERPRYLHKLPHSRGNLGADILLSDMIGHTRGRDGALSRLVDRERGFDIMFRTIKDRFIRPIVVETGCIRAAEDWSAGYATYLIGSFLKFYGGTLSSVDCDRSHCDFARARVKHLPVTVVCQDSVEFLTKFTKSIDILYLDSMDTDHPAHAEHGLAETQAALPHLHAESVIMFDDTVRSRNQWIGKGALAVPWLMQNGWAILHSGYQTALVRAE